MSQKRARRGPKAEAPPRETSRSEVNPELAHVDTDEDEDSNVQLRLRSSLTRGPIVANVKEVSEGLAEEQVTGSEPIPTSTTVLPQIVTAHSTSLMGQEKSTDPKDTQLGAPIMMMPLTGISKQNLTIEFVGTRPLAIEVSPIQVYFSSSSKRLDYSGDDFDWDNIRPAPDSNEFSYLTFEAGDYFCRW